SSTRSSRGWRIRSGSRAAAPCSLPDTSSRGWSTGASASAFRAWARASSSRRSGAAEALFPDRLARARQAQARPFLGDGLDHLVGHADLAATLALGLWRELGGGVETDLAAEACLRRGEVEIVDRRVLNDGDVAG